MNSAESEEVRAAMDKYTRERNAVKCLLALKIRMLQRLALVGNE